RRPLADIAERLPSKPPPDLFMFKLSIVSPARPELASDINIVQTVSASNVTAEHNEFPNAIGPPIITIEFVRAVDEALNQAHRRNAPERKGRCGVCKGIPFHGHSKVASGRFEETVLMQLVQQRTSLGSGTSDSIASQDDCNRAADCFPQQFANLESWITSDLLVCGDAHDF